VSEEPALIAQLSSLYAEVDARYVDARCPASTECCRFGITGREPQVTSIELAALRAAIARRGGPLRESRRALPLTPARDEGACPLLDHSGRCAVYAARPLGCRTFYCARADVPSPPSRAELRGYVRRLQELAARHSRDGDRPRALRSALPRA
jgi:uncharacterized protein